METALIRQVSFKVSCLYLSSNQVIEKREKGAISVGYNEEESAYWKENMPGFERMGNHQKRLWVKDKHE